jgi:hypothetical protein
MRTPSVSVSLSLLDIEIWTLKVRRAPDEELIALRSANYLGLRKIPDERWKLLVEIAEEELRHRFIGW